MSVSLAVTEQAVQLTLQALPVGDLLRVWRVMPDGSRTLVRGSAGLLDGTVTITTALMVIEDYEAPLLVPVSYRVETTDPATQVVTTTKSDTATVPHDDINTTWLKDIGNPQRNTMVLMSRPPNWTRPIEQAVYRVAERRNAVVHSGTRGGLEGDLVVWTRTDEERRALHWLLDSGNVLLWQAAPGLGVEDMYVTAGAAAEGRAGGPADDPWREWTLPLIQVDMPTTIGINGSAGRTWANIRSEYATWGDVLDAFDTWEDVFLNRPKAG